MWCACMKRERLDELGTLLAQMSAPQPDPADNPRGQLCPAFWLENAVAPMD